MTAFEIDANINVYYYPVEFERFVISAVLTGNIDEIARLMDILYLENFFRRKISFFMMIGLYNELKGTVIKIYGLMKGRIKKNKEEIEVITARLGKLNTEVFFEEAGCGESYTKIYSEVVDFIIYLGRVIRDGRTKTEAALVYDIRDFLQKNYNDPSICVRQVALKFNYSDTKFSYFFKEHFAENFSDYLEELRISAACELLLGGRFSLDEIAVKVGYNSSSVFRRAFRRVHGVNPSQYGG